MCEVFFCNTEQITGEQLLSLADRLSAGQQQKLVRLQNTRAWKNSLMALLLVRLLATEKLGIDNHLLQFETGEKGKPYLPYYPAFQFSISHSHNGVAVAVSDREAGVDIELLGKANFKVAERFFTPKEAAYIKKYDSDRRFFETWTRKEACIKWTGLGLSMPLGSFEVYEGNWSKLLCTCQVDQYVLSCCCEEQPANIPTVINATEILAKIWQLTPYI